MQEIACPHCGQDWIRKYRRKDDGSHFFMCPECESLWLREENLKEETELYLSEYLYQYEAATVWNAIEEIP